MVEANLLTLTQVIVFIFTTTTTNNNNNNNNINDNNNNNDETILITRGTREWQKLGNKNGKKNNSMGVLND